MHSSDAVSLHNAIALLEKTPKLLETLLAGVSAETLTWKPAPDRWSIAEVLAHLTGVEAVFSRRAERIVGEDFPLLESYDPPKGYAEANEAGGEAEDHVAGFANVRNGTIAFLSLLPPTAGERTGRHSELGTITLSEFLHHWACHDLGHLRQIAELYRAREFYSGSGGFQKYSSPKP